MELSKKQQHESLIADSLSLHLVWNYCIGPSIMQKKKQKQKTKRKTVETQIHRHCCQVHFFVTNDLST